MLSLAHRIGERKRNLGKRDGGKMRLGRLEGG
jgi:hypothetical protein